jgi:hypothetical protein
VASIEPEAAPKQPILKPPTMVAEVNPMEYGSGADRVRVSEVLHPLSSVMITV